MDELIEALKTIKAECSRHKHCFACPFGSTRPSRFCVLDRCVTPEEWDPEIDGEKIFLEREEET